MRRFIAMHKSEPGFGSPAEVMDWIVATQSHDMNSWRVVEIHVDPVTEEIARDFAESKTSKIYEDGYAHGVETTKSHIRAILGI